MSKFATFMKHDSRGIIEFTIEVATAQDLLPTAKLLAEREQLEASSFVEGLRESIQSSSCLMLSAFVDQQLVGHAKAKQILGEGVSHEGWYLSGLLVAPEYRRYGIGRALTQARVEHLKKHTNSIYYFVNVNNLASIALHEDFGFQFLTYDFSIPRLSFEGGKGALYIREGVANVGAS